MKKTFKTMLALMAGAMVFTACSNDDITENIPQQIPSALKPMTFTASMEGEAGATRAAIDGLDIKWTDGDKISIFDGATENNGNQEFTLTAGDGTTAGTFTGTAAEATTYYAIYPYTESSSKTGVPTQEDAEAAAGSSSSQLSTWKEQLSSAGMMQEFQESLIKTQLEVAGISPESQAIILAYLKGESLTTKSGPQFNAGSIEGVVLPAAQTATAGSADPQAMLMIGTSTDATTLEFKNVCAYVKVTPTFACSSIVLKSNGTESLAGTVTLGLDTDSNPTTTVTNGTNTVTLSGTIAANGTYCIAVCPATLANGFTVEFKDASDKVLSSKSTAKSVTLTRNKILNLGSFDATPVTTGTAKATIGGSEVDVNWVQLWADGPKFAEYNVGATSVTEYGGYYCWGKSTDKDPYGSYIEGESDLTGTDDTATNLWGEKWRMPTQAELEGLLSECDIEWTNDYNGTGKAGRIYTGKGDYSENSIFLPAAGCYVSENYGEEFEGYYQTSTHYDPYYSYILLFDESDGFVVDGNRDYGYSVRAVLAE